MERQGLINLVKIKLDELTPTGVALPFDDYIGPMLDESAIELLEKGPIHLLAPTVLVILGILYAEEKAFIPVPTDFIRLHEIKFPLWKKSVYKAISIENPDYKIQENEYLVGGYGRPSVTIKSTSTTGVAFNKYLVCSKVLPSATPLPATYIKKAKPEDLPDLLTESITWLCASKILHIGGKGNEAKLAYEQFANSLIQT